MLLALFLQWGMPKAIRTDNGSPFGVPTRDVIPPMSLWLKAWGIMPILNRPKMPTDNPNVENNQHTSARWAEVYKCQNIKQMEQQLDEAAAIQRDHFKVSRLGYATRKQVFDSLYNNPRKFEQAEFVTTRAYQMLAKARYPRLISSSGTIVIYDKAFSVGQKYAGEVTIVQFLPNEVAWECKNQKKETLRVIQDPRFSKENLYNLLLCQRT